MSKNKKLIKIEVTWSTRCVKVTSLTGGHEAFCLDLGDLMEITVETLPKEKKVPRLIASGHGK